MAWLRFACLGALVCACGDNVTIPPDPGSLVSVRVASKVGVLLDEFPAASRDRVAADILARPQPFWLDRAKLQLRLTALRLVYRELYYDESENKKSLPLPPEDVWTIDLGPPKREMIDGHDLVVVDYTMSSALLSDLESPGVSDAALAAINGSTQEDFVFPVDPTLLLQRTGFACMDEDEFPPDSVTAENAYEFYDDTCEVEDPLTISCHLTELPGETCVEAVQRVVGSVESSVHFKRVPWSDELAATVRANPITTATSPDLKVVTTGYQSLANHQIIYKYFAPDDCGLNEEPACVGGPGWRRLLAFDSIDHNVGALPLHIGPVDYFVEGLGGDLIDHNVYTLSACHNHFHFLYYGDFGFGAGTDQAVQKNGFCLESTGRLSNDELSPLHTPYNCENQGVSQGWVDLYAAGLTCNWVDITSVDTSAAAVTDKLFFHSNPDGFLCEGDLQFDDAGAQAFEPTTFTTPDGKPVDRPVCAQAAGTDTNDLGEVDVTVPQVGGMLTTACADDQSLGPTRNCGFAQLGALRACTAGAMKTITCTGGSATQPMAVRVCETSRALGVGLDCVFQAALANKVVEAGTTQVTFACPTSRDATETGGQFAVYAAPVFDPDGVRALTCN